MKPHRVHLRRGWPAAAGAVACSVLAHTALVAAAAFPRHDAFTLPELAAALTPPVAAAAIRAAAPVLRLQARRALVAEARAARQLGRLDVGDFVLRANAIDAEEHGRAVDLEAARAAFAGRVDALRTELGRGVALREAVPAVFADLRYFGRSGGLMAEALIERGGSCEPIAQLVASAVLAARRRPTAPGPGHQLAPPTAVALRFWGDDSAEPAHLTAVITGAGGVEHDLLSGTRSLRGGVRFAAEDLVEAYARRHRLDPSGPEVSHRASRAAAAEPGRDARDPAALPSMAAGYPGNADRFPGSMPIFASRAVHDPDDTQAEPSQRVETRQRAQDCAFFLRMALLDPPRVDLENGASFEPRRMPRATELERQAALLDAVEQLAAARDTHLADRLMGWACLVALSERTAVDLTLAGERALADVALAKGRRASSDARAAMDAVPRDGPEALALRERLSREFAGRTWLLLVLPGGDRLAFDLVTTARPEDWGQVNALAALVVSPSTRARAMVLLGSMPRRDQIDVMHEVFHAHDHQRPWATNFELRGSAQDCPPAGCDPSPAQPEFARAYRVFRGMAWRLWEGARPVAEVLAALDDELGAAHLDPEWESVMVGYYGRNVLGLYRHRADGLDAVSTLLASPVMAKHEALGTLRRRLQYVLSQGRLDAVTISDAWRLK